jgi:hypothetical protein
VPEDPYPTAHPGALPPGITVGWLVTPSVMVAVDQSPMVVLITPAGQGRGPAVRSDVPDAERLAQTVLLARLYVAAVPARRGRPRGRGPVPPDADPDVRHSAFLALASAWRIAPAIDALDAEQRVSDFIRDYAARYPGTGFTGYREGTAVLMSLFARTWTHRPGRYL